uniref:TsaA-like domain-containing protein n=1 Tax=Kalanchoe fedtschenkoi TaxID=63787 RepID=A0A7N0U7A2_KALFE
MALKWTTTLSVVVVFAAAVAATSAFSVHVLKKKCKKLLSKIGELEDSLTASLRKRDAERQGRIRAQQALRATLTKPNCDDLKNSSYPMTPIGVVESCFSTRNGTPRQPLLVPLARARLVFDASRVPAASLEGLEEYSHCWIMYIFHLNTDLEKLWKPPSQSKFKAKVRVPRLKGERIGVFATRTPHRPCPIGLTVAKVEAVKGNIVLLSGVDLVNGTPVLDVKPYLPYCDSIQGATVPGWVKVDHILSVTSVIFSEHFSAALVDCWSVIKKRSLYTTPNEFQSLIKQILSWDIRSVSQRNKPHGSQCEQNCNLLSYRPNSNIEQSAEHASTSHGAPVYHLELEGLDISYRIDNAGNVTVDNVTLLSHVRSCNHYSMSNGFATEKPT